MTRIAVDTSALIRLVYREPDWQAYHDTLLGNDPHLSAGSLVELGRILTVRFRQAAGEEKLEDLLRTYRIRVVTHDETKARLAIAAAVTFGTGRGAPPAVLNYGDLFSYALAEPLDLPLLYKGRDFAATDVRPALAGA